MFRFVASLVLLIRAPIHCVQVELKPDALLPLGGYTERHDQIEAPGGDPLYVRVQVFQRRRRRMALAAVETLTIPESFYEAVRKRIPPDVGLFLVATHTHSAPDSQLLNDRVTFKIPGIAKFEPKWLEWYADKVAGAISEALVRPVDDFEGMRDLVVNVDFNRARRKLATPDTRAILVETRNGNPVFAWYTAHGTLYDADENHTRGDWMGALAARLGAPVLPGALGDVSPVAPGKTPHERVDALASGLLAAFHKAQPFDLGAQFDWAQIPVVLPPATPHPEFAKEYKIPEALAGPVVTRIAPATAVVTAFRLGNLAVVGLSCEPTSEVGRRIEEIGRRMGFEQVVVVAHVDGWAGYLLDDKDYRRGGYEASLDLYGPDGWKRFADAAEVALGQLRGLKRQSK